MNLGSHLVQRMLRLDPPLTRDLAIERDLRVPMPDGVVLLANLWAPKAGGDGLPVALLTGQSYLGFAQWTLGDELPPEVKAMIPNNTESAFTLEFLRQDGLSLETPFGWGVLVDGQEQRGALLRMITVSSVGGWYDIFLPGQLRDFQVLQSLGRRPRLTVGPWTHLSMDGAPVREVIGFGLAHARGEEPPPRPPVRLYVTGEEAWRDFESWPPAGYPPTRYHLDAGGVLTDAGPGQASSGPDRYRYDPADPTPAAGGARMNRSDRGRVDNTALEARPDVLTYTTAPLPADIEVIGEVSAEIWFSASMPSADVFVRLCDVDTGGRSWNVCDGLTRLASANEPAKAVVSLWPTAHRFKRGHRIRVQVSSGAFPRFARNPGTGEPHATATRLLASDQSVYHDPAHPSAIVLPIRKP